MQIWGKFGFFSVLFSANVGFWGKNGGWFVKLWGLGKIGKKKMVKNCKKCAKIVKKLAEICRNACFFAQK